MNRRQVALVAGLLGATIPHHVAAAQSAQPSAKAADSVFLALLQPLRDAGDTTTDMTALRRAFAATSFYSPYDSDRDEQRKRMWSRIDGNDPIAAGQVADSLLDANYLDLDTQLGAGVAALGRGDSTTARRHFAIARALVRSIESTGDGRSAEHPLFVIAPSEEYSYLSIRGLRRSGMQALGACGGHRCDELQVTPRDGGAEFSLYFDVSLPMEWMTRKFSEGETDAKPNKP